MSSIPQPRPKKKRSDGEDPGDDEALVPDEVTGPDDVVAHEPDGGEPLPRARPDRRPLWALIAGLSAVWFTILGSILSFVIAPLAIYLGWRAMKRIDLGEGDSRERRKAKIGFIAGVVAAVLLVVQIVLFILFFEWEKVGDDVEFNEDKPALSGPPTAEETDGGGEPGDAPDGTDPGGAETEPDADAEG